MQTKQSSETSRLVLGTAQLGMIYGISNKIGKPDPKTAEGIIKTAWESGIFEFDTAQSYGESEKILGNCLSLLGISKYVSIISKTHQELDHIEFTKIQNILDITLNNTKCDHLYGYLLHREDILEQWNDGLGEILFKFKEKGLIEHIGISVYSPEKAIQALKTDHISIVQLPSNILDRRFENAGVFELADKLKKNIYVRSVFLQGLIFMNAQDIPSQLLFAAPVLQKLEIFALEKSIPKHDLALLYTKQAYPNAKIIIGAETPEQVLQNVRIWEDGIYENIVDEVRYTFNEVDERILNPTRWFSG